MAQWCETEALSPTIGYKKRIGEAWCLCGLVAPWLGQLKPDTTWIRVLQVPLFPFLFFPAPENILYNLCTGLNYLCTESKTVLGGEFGCGVAHLSNSYDAGTLRQAQWERKSHVEQKAKCWILT